MKSLKTIRSIGDWPEKLPVYLKVNGMCEPYGYLAVVFR